MGFLWIALGLLVSIPLVLGAWWGFPVQDDTYLVRLLHMGGPDLVLSEHVTRPLSGWIISSFARVAGEHRFAYVLAALAAWWLLAALCARLWVQLFPEWKGGALAVALAAVAPVLTRIQFTSITTIAPCVLPVSLVLAATILLLDRAERRGRVAVGVLAAGLCVLATAISEYGLATGAAAIALLLVLRRPFPALAVGSGVAAGYALFRVISNVRIHTETDPGLQFVEIVSRPMPRPFWLLSAVWHCLVGAWAAAASEVSLEWGSRSTLVAVPAGIAIAFVVARLLGSGSASGRAETHVRRLAALAAAVASGLVPVVLIQGWPHRLVYETRWELPILAFASCATVALFYTLASARYLPAVLAVFAFVAGDRLVAGAFEQRALAADYERFGRLIRPYVQQSPGLLVLVAPEVDGQSDLDAMVKATLKWKAEEKAKFWIVRPIPATRRFGPRLGCRNPANLPLEPVDIGWPRSEGPIARILWKSSLLEPDPPEDYFQGCCGKALPGAATPSP
jgi:hypothetical protein